MDIVNGMGSVSGYLTNMPADTHIVQVSVQTDQASQIRLSVGAGTNAVVQVWTSVYLFI